MFIGYPIFIDFSIFIGNWQLIGWEEKSKQKTGEGVVCKSRGTRRACPLNCGDKVDSLQHFFYDCIPYPIFKMSPNVPVNTKLGDLFLARFAGYLLWPVRILESVPTSKGPKMYHVFCYGKKNDRQLVTSEQLVSYKDNVTEASAKKTRGVDAAFDELREHPDVYKQYLKGSNTAADCAAGLRNLVNATEQDLLTTKKNLSETIEKKIAEKLKSTGSTPAASTVKFPTETMVSEIHDAIIIEFSPKFNIIEKQLKSYLHAIEILENRVTQLEAKVEDYEQEAKLDSLLFNGVKQKPSQNLNPADN